MRRSGILLPITSIPSEYGIGTMGKEAYGFVDFLKEAGQKLWQILPLGPTGYGDSPYQSFSTFAGNPYYIDLETLAEEGLLTREECLEYDFGTDERYIDYEKIYDSRFQILKKAFQRFAVKHDERFEEFKRENAYWLKDYALFMAIKDSLNGKSFLEWEADIKLREPEAVRRYETELTEEISFYEFQQYEFQKQWQALKKYANENGVQIVGDLPIYVAMDSADTWSQPQLFQVNEERIPKAVAGCPPDAFSSTGQLWGNPLYNWEYHKNSGYQWWIQRLSYCYKLYDIVRIDHFRGFDEYYSIPYEHQTAQFGHWEKGPGYDIFEAFKQELGEVAVIAEDLGYLTQSVLDLVKKCGYPGMKILQFAFDSGEENDYLPHNYIRNCVVYTGTHDNDTTAGWYHSFADSDRDFINRYLGIEHDKDIHIKFIRLALSSVADTAIIPMQDYLGLGSEARINRPSTLGENWKWRLKKGQCTGELAASIRNLSKLYGRV